MSNRTILFVNAQVSCSYITVDIHDILSNLVSLRFLVTFRVTRTKRSVNRIITIIGLSFDLRVNAKMKSIGFC